MSRRCRREPNIPFSYKHTVFEPLTSRHTQYAEHVSFYSIERYTDVGVTEVVKKNDLPEQHSALYSTIAGVTEVVKKLPVFIVDRNKPKYKAWLYGKDQFLK